MIGKGIGIAGAVCTPAQPLGRLRQEDHKLEASLSNLVRRILKIKRAGGWGCGSVVEGSPTMCEALGSILSTK